MIKEKIKISLIILCIGFPCLVTAQQNIQAKNTLNEYFLNDTLLQLNEVDFTSALIENWIFRNSNQQALSNIRLTGVKATGVITTPADDIADTTADSVLFAVDDESKVYSASAAPQYFKICENYLKPTTTISFNLVEKTHVKLTVHNVLGQLISILINQEIESGSNRIMFNVIGLPAGVYFFHIKSGHQTATQKMILMM